MQRNVMRVALVALGTYGPEIENMRMLVVINYTTKVVRARRPMAKVHATVTSGCLIWKIYQRGAYEPMHSSPGPDFDCPFGMEEAVSLGFRRHVQHSVPYKAIGRQRE